MTLSDLAELARGATKGPWSNEYDGVHVDHTIYSDTEDDNTAVATTWGVAHGVTPEQAQADASYIAACSPERILALIAVAEAAERMLGAVCKDYGYCEQCGDNCGDCTAHGDHRNDCDGNPEHLRSALSALREMSKP